MCSNEKEKHYALGIALGYPKKSVEFFSRMDQMDETEKKKYKVWIRWAGITFSTHIDIVEQEVNWLWRRYDHPEARGNPLYLWDYDEDYIEIPYDDLNRLKEVRDYIMVKRGLVPAVNS